MNAMIQSTYDFLIIARGGSELTIRAAESMFLFQFNIRVFLILIWAPPESAYASRGPAIRCMRPIGFRGMQVCVWGACRFYPWRG